MKATSPCPAAEELDLFLRSVCDTSEHEALAQHLSVCPRCRRVAEQRAEHAAWSDDLRWAAQVRSQTHIEVNVPQARLNELLNDYEIMEEIGRGGMGIVFKARHIRLDRIVALKVLPALLGVVRPDAVARFKQEATLAARLRHTNIMPIFDFGQIDGTFYYTMPLVDGRSLHAVLAEAVQTGSVDALIGRSNDSTAAPRAAPESAVGSADSSYYRRLVSWMIDAADALQYAHEKGIIHRDIKLANLLLADDGRVLILDFGLAKCTATNTTIASRTILGTARYMSPEQIDAALGPVDERSDIYGLGVSMYELLTFRPLYNSVDDRAILHSVLHEEPIRPQRRDRRVPRELEIICLKAIDKCPSRRYRTAGELADDLRRWQLGLPILARPTPLPSRIVKFVRRRKAASAFLAAVAGGLILSGSLFAQSRHWREEAITAEVAFDKAEAKALSLGAQNDRNQAKYDSALSKIRQARQIDPANVTYRTVEADLILLTGDWKRGVRLLEAIVEGYPDDSLAQYLLASHYLDALSEFNDSRFDLGYTRDELRQRAVDRRNDVARLLPNSDNVKFLDANLTDDTNEAIALLTSAAQGSPEKIEIFLFRAALLTDLDRLEESLLDSERAIGLMPNCPDGYFRRAEALQQLDRSAEAADAFSRAIELNPRNAAAWAGRGAARGRIGKFAESLADLNEALRLKPDYALAYIFRASAHAGLGNLDLAESDCNHGLALNPFEHYGYSIRVNLNMPFQRWEDIVADASQMIELSPAESCGYRARAFALRGLGRYERAILDFTELIQLEPYEPMHFRERANANLALGRIDDACADFGKAIRLQPTASDYVTRAYLMYARGRYDAALPDLSRAIELDPGDGSVFLRRGFVFEALGVQSGAIADYERAAEYRSPMGEYAILWLAVLHGLKGDTDAAGAALVRLPSPPGSWTDSVRRHLTGDMSADALLAAAVTTDETCEAHYYIGAKYAIDSVPSLALQSWGDCVATGRSNILELDVARYRLSVLQPMSRPAEQTTQFIRSGE